MFRGISIFMIAKLSRKSAACDGNALQNPQWRSTVFQFEDHSMILKNFVKPMIVMLMGQQSFQRRFSSLRIAVN